MSEAARHQMLADEQLRAKQLAEKLAMRSPQSRPGNGRSNARPQPALFSPKPGGRGR